MRAHSFAAVVASALSLISGTEAFMPIGSECMGTVCADGYFCSPDTYLCERPTKSQVESLRKRQSTAYTPVTGPVNSGTKERQNIQVMQTNSADSFNMYIWALSVMQTSISENHPLSYYQISGIHGRPYIAWMEPTSSAQNPTTGYCTHSSALFATWHRPYLALFEQRVVATALNEASKYPSGSAARNRWFKAAQDVRVPYWDWASSDLRSGIPPIVMQSRISVVRPVNGVATTQNIANPLYQYSFVDQTLKNRWFEGFYNRASATRRNPTNNGAASQNSISDSAMRNSYASRRQNTFNLFTQPTFRQFSNTQFSAGGDPGSFNSVEAIHNEIHVNCGGTGNSNGDLGHMTVVDYSSFDPIFWLHHCNVDRLIALYQAIHPDRGMEAQPATSTFARRAQQGDMDNISTPLHPFRKTSGSYYTSADVMSASSIWNLGYAYSDVPVRYKGRPSSELSTYASGRVRALYGPTSSGSSRKRAVASADFETWEWNVHIVFNPMETKSSTECRIFVGNYTSNGQDSKSDPTYVGSGVSFKKASTSDAPSQQSSSDPTEDKFITSSVSLPKEKLNGIDPSDIQKVVAHLKANLHWYIFEGSDVIPTENIKSLLVGVSARKVTFGSGSALPETGVYNTFYECTAGKVGGLTLLHHDLVKSIDKPNVLGGPIIIEPPTPVVGYDRMALGSEKTKELQDQKLQVAKDAGVKLVTLPSDDTGGDAKDSQNSTVDLTKTKTQ